MDDIKKISQQIVNNFSHLEKRIKSTESEIAKLTRMGTSNCKFYVRKEKKSNSNEERKIYYLLSPMKNGKRKKIYIGVDPVKVQKAQDKMKRFEDREKLIALLFELEKKRDTAKELLVSCLHQSTDGNLMNYFLEV